MLKTDTPARLNAIGAAWMIVAMAAFALEDALVKAVSDLLPVGPIMMLFGLGGAALFAIIARAQGDALMTPDVLSRAMRVRVYFEITGRLFYVLALALIPLSTATVILQATPLVVVACAALIFGERVGWRRWTAIGLGLMGVLIILRPGTGGFSALSLLAVAGMLGFAGRDLATRAAPRVLSNRQLGTLGFAMLGLAGVIVLSFTGGAHLPDARGWGFLLGCTCFGLIGYHALTAAMRTGEVGAVTPFRYTRLVFAMILAVTFLGERPGTAVLVGSALVVLAGVYGLTQRGARRIG